MTDGGRQTLLGAVHTALHLAGLALETGPVHRNMLTPGLLYHQRQVLPVTLSLVSAGGIAVTALSTHHDDTQTLLLSGDLGTLVFNALNPVFGEVEPFEHLIRFGDGRLLPRNPARQVMLGGAWVSVEDTPVAALQDTLERLHLAPGWTVSGPLMSDGEIVLIAGGQSSAEQLRHFLDQL